MLFMYFLGFLAFISMSLILGTVTQPIFGQSSADTVVPKINILDPSWCNAVGSGKVIVNGTSGDNGTGVKIVEVRVDKNKYVTTDPISAGNWSSWSVPIEVNDTDPHRILARAAENSGNQNWEDITIISPISIGNHPNDTAPIKDKKF